MILTSQSRLAVVALALASLIGLSLFASPSSPNLRSLATPPQTTSDFSLTVGSSLPGPPGLSPALIPPANVSFRASINGSGAPIGPPNWNFGDGSAARGIWTPGHVFSGVGRYLVVASANDSAGQYATGSFPIFVDNSFPFGGGFASIITASPEVTPANQTVSFSPGFVAGTVLNYSWSFGDGNTSNRSNPNHAFRAGTYAVRLIEGLSGVPSAYPPVPPSNVTSVVTVVSVAPYGTLSAAVNTTNATWWGVGPYCSVGPLNLNETFVPMVAGGVSPYSSVWTFGDGSVVSSSGPVFHSFTGNTSRTALLTVTDSRGMTATAVVATSASPPIYVGPPCPPPPPPPFVFPLTGGLVFLLFGFGIATIAVAVAVVVRFGPSRPPQWP